MGLKPSDFRAIPLDPHLHIDLHNDGEEAYFRKMEVDHEKAIIIYLSSYLREMGRGRILIEAMEQIAQEKL